LGSHPLLHTPLDSSAAVAGNAGKGVMGGESSYGNPLGTQQQMQWQPPQQQQQGVAPAPGLVACGDPGNLLSPTSAAWPAAWTQAPPVAGAASPVPVDSWQQQQQQQQQLPLHPPVGWPHMQAPLLQQQQGPEAGQQQSTWFTTNLSPQQPQVPWSASNPYPSLTTVQEGQGLVPCTQGPGPAAAGDGHVTRGGTSRAPVPVVTTAVDAPPQPAGMQFAAGAGRGRGRGRGRQQAAADDGEPISRWVPALHLAACS
jgi:hypothetical protein